LADIRINQIIAKSYKYSHYSAECQRLRPISGLDKLSQEILKDEAKIRLLAVFNQVCTDRQ